MTCLNKAFLSAPLLFLLTLLSATAQQTSTNTQRKVESQQPERLVLNVTVMNGRGEFVTGLKRENFAILVDKVPSQIFHFSDEDVPISVGIVFDSSGSMYNMRYGPKKFKILREAIARFLALSNRSSEYFVIGFNNRPQLLLDWTSDARAVVDRLSDLQPKGTTAFYDTCYLSVEKVMHGRYSKRAIILLSDGQDNESHYTFKELRDLIRESNVLVYSINLLGSDYAGSALGDDGQAILNELSWTSGGRVFYQKEGARLKDTEVSAVLEMIAEELRHQYSIAILPGGHAGERKWRKIKINLTPATDALPEMKHLSVRTREGYYSDTH